MKIRVMPDYSSTGLWDVETGASINVPSDIPYWSEDILNAWQAMYDQLNDDDGSFSLDNNKGYVSMGRAIVRLLEQTKQTDRNEYIWWEDLEESSFNQKEFWVG